MWTTALPDAGNIDEQLDAALCYKDGTAAYTLDAAQRAAVHTLYADYDARLGEPDPALKPAALDNCADALHEAYQQVQKGRRLATLRDRLLAGVIECPFCGTAPATTLDHHLPQNEYRALSINPRNLVPTCQQCNRAKGTLAALPGHGLIHAYFQEMPRVTFLVAEISYAAGALTVKFVIAPATLDPVLAARLTFQLDRLRFDGRQADAINLFLFGQKTALNLFRGHPSERALIARFLEASADTLDADLGLNHWRPAVLRGLAGCDAFLDDPWAYLDKPPKAMRAR